MIRAFDFLCAKGHRVEHFINADEKEMQCPCGLMGERQVASPRSKLEPFTGSFPGAADKWARDRDSKMKQEQRNKEQHGTYK